MHPKWNIYLNKYPNFQGPVVKEESNAFDKMSEKYLTFSQQPVSN